MGSRLLRSIACGYSYSQRRFLYPCSSATFQSLPNSAFASSPRPASWEPKPLFTPANIRFFAASPGSYGGNQSCPKVAKVGLCGRLLTESNKDQTLERIEPGILGPGENLVTHKNSINMCCYLLSNYCDYINKPRASRTTDVPVISYPGSSKVLVVNSDLEFSNLLSKAQEEKSLAVAYFTAVWCGPCRTIAPLVDNLSASYPNVTFMKLDIDQENLSNTLRNSGVSSVPTFHFYKKGVKVADLIGADPVRLKEIIGNLSD